RRWLDVEAGDVSEILDQRAVEAVEHDEFGLVDVGAKARAASEHLLPQDARLHWAQEYDEFQRRNVHAGREHVHGDDDLGIGAIAEPSDALERAVRSYGSETSTSGPEFFISESGLRCNNKMPKPNSK